LADLIIMLSKGGFPLSRKDIQKLAGSVTGLPKLVLSLVQSGIEFECHSRNSCVWILETFSWPITFQAVSKAAFDLSATTERTYSQSIEGVSAQEAAHGATHKESKQPVQTTGIPTL
jgi:hypothetical protein